MTNPRPQSPTRPAMPRFGAGVVALALGLAATAAPPASAAAARAGAVPAAKGASRAAPRPAARTPDRPAARKLPSRLASPAGDYAAMVARKDGGHVMGNPDAPNRLVEYMSYTCSHCAEFAHTGDPAIRLFLVPKGAVSYEIRHLLRDPVDLTATLLTHCGEPDRFPGNHEAILSRFAQWMAVARAATPAQKTRWSYGTNTARWRAIASDLGFYAIMEDRGYSRATLDRCLADTARAETLAATSQRDVEALNLTGTPSFALNGKLLSGVSDWETLKPVMARLDREKLD